jgi:hypothetical protein
VKGDKTNLDEKEPDKIYSLGASLPLIDMSEAMQVHVCAVLWILRICVESWIGKEITYYIKTVELSDFSVWPASIFLLFSHFPWKH